MQELQVQVIVPIDRSSHSHPNIQALKKLANVAFIDPNNNRDLLEVRRVVSRQQYSLQAQFTRYRLISS